MTDASASDNISDDADASDKAAAHQLKLSSLVFPW